MIAIPPAGLQLGLQPAPQRFIEPAQDIPGRPVGPDILRARQPLPEEAEVLGARLPGRLPAGQGDISGPEQHQQVQQGEAGQGQPRPPVDGVENTQNAQQEHPVGEYQDDKLREEAGQQGHIAVDPLDHLARGAPLVEGEVQAQGVERQVGPELVGRPPAYILAQVGGADGEELVADGQGEEEERPLGQGPDGGAIHGAIDDPLQHSGVVELQTDRPGQDGYEQENLGPEGAEVGPEQVPVAPQGYLHECPPRWSTGAGPRT